MTRTILRNLILAAALLLPLGVQAQAQEIKVTIDKCPKDKQRTLTFPQALRKLMAEDGYPLPKDPR